MPITPEVQKAIENIWDHRNIHLGDTRIPCDGEVIKNYIDSQDAEVERLRNSWREDRRNVRWEMDDPDELGDFDRSSYRLIFGVDFSGELNEDVLKRIYGKYWR